MTNVMAMLFAICISDALAATRDAQMIIKQGDSFYGSTVRNFGLGSPFTDGNGKVNFNARLEDGRYFLWRDTGPVFYSGDVISPALTSPEQGQGFSDSGNFIHRPNSDGSLSIYTSAGLTLRMTDPAPDFPGKYILGVSRPTMQPDGTAYWYATVSDTPGGAITNNVIYKASGPTYSGITKVIAGNDVIDGFTVRPNFGNVKYDISDNNAHHVQILNTTEAAAADTFLFKDGSMALREGSSTGQGDNWGNFNTVCVNDFGNYLVSGDTSLPSSANDQFLAYNGLIVMREGDTIDGYSIPTGSRIEGASINNLNHAAYVWTSSNSDALLYGDASSLATTSKLLLKTTDSIDINNDSIPDYLISTILVRFDSQFTMELAEDGWIHVMVGLTDMNGLNPTRAIIRLGVPEPTTAALLALGLLVVARRRR
ncbi:MAG: PEP-CTERM sorting domain-containing protein [Planctomycetes bacterium]|nr:PEP-CTERM sorting domain-containing protein [Planctomycetota bacterium]